MKYLIVGLGNIGSEYEETRHNIGFRVLDALLRENDLSFELARYGYISNLKYKGKHLFFLKPNTYMNLSGKAVRFYLRKEKINPENLLVITDDLAIPFGAVRLRKKGSDGGHNGLKSIIQELATTDFPRLRFGIGSDFFKSEQTKFVLGKWLGEEKEILDNKLIPHCLKIVKSFAFDNIDRTMSTYNKRKII